MNSLLTLLTAPNSSPTISPDTADAHDFGADTTPAIQFTPSDVNGDDVSVEVELSDSAYFDDLGIPAVGNSTQNSGTSGDVSIALPSGNIGDKLVVVVTINGQSSIGDNNGGTALTEDLADYQPNPTNGHTVSVFSRVLTGSEPTTLAFTNAASSRWAAVAFIVRAGYDIAPSSGNAANTDDSANGDISAPSISVSNNSVHIVVAAWDTSLIGTISTPSGYTLIKNANGGGEPLHVSYKNFSTGGATGSVACSNTEYGARIAFSFSLKSRSTVFLDKVSGTDSGFANDDDGGDTDPFTQGDQLSFTVQAGDALAVGTYYWRARAKDPSGSNTWGSWTTTRSFSISSSTSISVSDTASGSDILSGLIASVQTLETSSGTDGIQSLVAKISAQETASALDALSLHAIVQQTDAGNANEIDIVSVVLSTIADTLAGVDAAALISVIAEMDNFSGSDIVNIVATANQVSISETGSASEILGILAICKILESCAGVDNFNVLVNTKVVDVSGGSDSVFQSAIIPTIDTASGADIAKIVASMNIIDFASGFEVLLLAVAVSQTDPCIAIDTIAILNRFAMIDSAIGNEQEYIAGKILLSETGAGDEVAQLITYIFSSDSAAGAENIVKIWKKIYTRVSGKYDTITGKYTKISSPYSPKI